MSGGAAYHVDTGLPYIIVHALICLLCIWLLQNWLRINYVIVSAAMVVVVGFTRMFHEEMTAEIDWIQRKQKGGFVKGRFWRMYPRPSFWYRGTSECTLVPCFWHKGTSTNHPFGNHPVLQTRDWSELRWLGVGSATDSDLGIDSGGIGISGIALQK